MSLKIKFDRLDYQAKAVSSISGVFKNVRFKPNDNQKSNPSFELNPHRAILAENIANIRELNGIESVFDYSPKRVQNYINATNTNISVLISTYQSFNSASNKINKRGVEQSLIGRAKSYMEARGVNVEYQTKLNSPKLSQMISQIIK